MVNEDDAVLSCLAFWTGELCEARADVAGGSAVEYRTRERGDGQLLLNPRRDRGCPVPGGPTTATLIPLCKKSAAVWATASKTGKGMIVLASMRQVSKLGRRNLSKTDCVRVAAMRASRVRRKKAS